MLLPRSLSKYAVTRRFIKIRCYLPVYQNTLLLGSLLKYTVTRPQFIKIRCYQEVYQNTLLLGSLSKYAGNTADRLTQTAHETLS